MLEGFIDWLIEALSERVRLWLLVILTLASITIIVISSILKTQNLEWLQITSEFAKIILTAIFAGAILKILVLEGYFKRTLSELLYERRWLERLDEVERKTLWRRLTLLIYAPFLNQQNLPELTEKLVSAVETNFDYTQKFYQASWNRQYVFEWESESNDKKLVMTEKFRTRLIPFNKLESVTWTTIRTAEAHLGLNNYENTSKLKINGKDPDKDSFTCKTEGQKEITTYTLVGRDKYDIFRERLQKWDVDDDPGYLLEATTVINGGDIIITNHAKGLQVVVKEAGGLDLFETFDNPIVECDSQYSAAIRSILLPKQGFQLMFLRREPAAKPGSEATAEPRPAESGSEATAKPAPAEAGSDSGLELGVKSGSGSA